MSLSHQMNLVNKLNGSKNFWKILFRPKYKASLCTHFDSQEAIFRFNGDPNVNARINWQWYCWYNIQIELLLWGNGWGLSIPDDFKVYLNKVLHITHSLNLHWKDISQRRRQNRNVWFFMFFTDVINDDDCKTIWFKRSIEIDCMVKCLQKGICNY